VAKPIVNGIEKDLKGRAEVIRLDLLSRVGREVAATYGVSVAPTTILFDGEGNSTFRTEGLPNRKAFVERASAP
jgi:thioredoxin-related protein